MKNEYYVYSASVDGEVIYIGSGKEGRYTHVTSGKSHNEGLNYLQRKGEAIDVEIVAEGMSKADARAHEQTLIDQYRPAFNKGIAASKSSIKESAEAKEIRERIANVQPSIQARNLCNLLWGTAGLTGDSRYTDAAFELSIADKAGSIIYRQEDYNNFMDKLGKKYYNNYRNPSRLLQGSAVYETTVEAILSYDFVQDALDGCVLESYSRRLEKHVESFKIYNASLQQVQLF